MGVRRDDEECFGRGITLEDMAGVECMEVQSSVEWRD